MGPQSFEQRTRLGNTYTASSPKTAFSIAGNLRGTIQNPNGSGRTIFIYAFALTNDSGAAGYGQMFLNPSTNLPTTVLTNVNQNFSSANTAVAVVKADSGSALAAGTGSALWPIDAPGNSRTVMKEELVVLPPNTTIGFNMPYILAANGAVRVYWWEETN